MRFKQFLNLALSIGIFTQIHLNAEAPKDIPANLLSQYTMGGQVPVIYWYFDDTYLSNKPQVYNKGQVNTFVRKAMQQGTNYYGETDTYLYAAFKKYSNCIAQKQVAVLGSVTPWYESIVIASKGFPFTIDYNRIISRDPRIKTTTVGQYEKNPWLFDALLSISSFEHDGLGRYGDPLDPDGDLKAMQKAKKMVKPSGVLFLAVPVGPDTLVWNAHRIYGAIRLPLLLEGWEILDSFGYSSEDLKNNDFLHAGHQPVFVLRAKP